MRNEEWKLVEDILDAALELEPSERREFLDEAGATNSELLREVESLLACEEQVDGFLAAPALALSSDFFADDSLEERAGQTVGRYRIIREIGRGGMGTVYLAERSDGEFQQRLALKIVRRSFADSDLARRFRQERQILASLNHPNIARLLDGGVTAEGEPFLAMEYIEGVRIDDYCDARSLSTAERLSLFVAVCEGVSYAHQNLIVHRDIKPSNILVTDEGVPKLLDFGIAKLINPEAEAGAAETVTGLRAMTPDYASPEQVRGLSVTTATDVYSLGVLLYELLTGHRPHRLKNRRTDEIARVICEEEPERPSTAVSRVEEVPGADSGTLPTLSAEMISERRGRTPEQLRRTLRGDLDNIVLMAMRKEPQRRYASPTQLADDVNRYLEGRPVLAHKDTFSYRAAKFVRRHKAGAAAAMLVALALVAGIVGTAWQARRATAQARIAAAERDRARIEAAKAKRINEFLQSIFASADPSWYSSGFGQRGEVRVVDVLEQAGRRIDVELKDEPEIRAELHHTIGTTFQSLGQFEQANTHFREALDTYRALFGERHPKVAEALYYLGASMVGTGEYSSGLALYRQSLDLFHAVDPNNANVPYLLADLSGHLSAAGETVAAEQAVREGLEIARKTYGDEHMLTLTLLGRLGTVYEMRGDLRQAETSYQTVLATSSRMPNGRLLSPGWLEDLGRISIYKGEFKQAEAQYREAFDTSRQTRNETHPQQVNLLLMLAELHYLQGAYTDAEKEAKSALDLLQRSPPRNPSYQLKGLSLLSLIHAKTNRRARAAVFLREALTQFKTLREEERYQDDGLLGEALVAMKREAEARSLLQKRHDFFAGRYGEQNPQAVITRQQIDRLDGTTRSIKR